MITQCIIYVSHFTARTNSEHERHKRNGSPAGSRLLGTNLLNVPKSSNRSRSSDRQRSPKTKLDIPQITVTEVTSSSSLTDVSSIRNDHSDTTFNKPRCRSASPFDWIEREKLPCGSPTFERVKSDMLSDSETSPMNSDAEERTVKKSIRAKKKTPKTVQTNSYYLKNRGKFKYW
jgi:hypothetical protein